MTYRTIQLMWVLGLATQIHLPVKESSQGVTIPVGEFGARPVLKVSPPAAAQA